MTLMPGSKTAEALLEVGLRDATVLRSLMTEIGLSRQEAEGALAVARRRRNVNAWAIFARSEPTG